MNLLQFIQRDRKPQPWSEGDNLPWNDPGFSERMLKEHLSQEHDAASRRSGIIEQHIRWIQSELLGGRPARVLDLGCGPGLYTTRLARLGHVCRGIDYSPASIRYARETAVREEAACTYELGDLRQASFGDGYGLVMMIFGEFNAFKPADAGEILQKSWDALLPGGVLLLEPHTYEAVREMAVEPPYWYSTSDGLFSDRPYLYLQENFWNEGSRAAVTRYSIIDAETAAVEIYSTTMQAYSVEEYYRLLESAGFSDTRFFPSLGGPPGEMPGSLIAITARKPSSFT